MCIRDSAEADLVRSGLQGRLGLGVAGWFVVDEEHRAPQHGAIDRVAGGGLGPLLELPQVAGRCV